MKVAVIGSGVSGLGAAWLLNEYSEHEVHIFEADSRAGGHANTVCFRQPEIQDAKPVDVDSGFIVFNMPTYPNFARFLNMCGIPWQPTEMTFSVSRNRGAFEWAGKNLFTIFCQASNLFNPSIWRMIWDVLRFNAAATMDLSSKTDVFRDRSLGQYLREEGYSDGFINDYMLPMTASIWSTPPDICALDFPASSHARFLYNHHLLQITGKPPWLTIKGGSRKYVQRILSLLAPGRLHLSTPVESVSAQLINKDDPGPKPVVLRTLAGETFEFDHVIMATHANITLEILERGKGGATDTERQVLQGFGWAKNDLVVHSDISLMPQRKTAWSSWNFLTSSNAESVQQVCLTYYMNELQHISEKEHGPVLCTLNPLYEPDQNKVVTRVQYEHPIFTKNSVWAQKNLHRIQNTRGITFAGAWTNHGFHEDGFTSGLLVAQDYLGAEAPFIIRHADRPVDSGLGTWFKFFEGLKGLQFTSKLWLWSCSVLFLTLLVKVS